MKLKIRSLLWICLLLSIILMTPAICHRVANESINKSVIITADFYELNKILDESKYIESDNQAPNYSFVALFEKLKDNHISTLAVKEIKGNLNNSSGFDTQIIEKLKNNGFEIILRPSGSNHSKEYYEELDSTISRFGIKYIIFDENSSGLSDSDISAFSKIFTKNNIYLILSENHDQTGYIKFPGLDELIAKTEFKLSRAYILTDNDLKHLNSKDIQYRWLRAVVDRNIRLVYVKPLNSSSLTVNQSLQYSLDAAKGLSLLLNKKGYEVNKPLNGLSSKPLNNYSLFIIMLSIILAIILYFEYLFHLTLYKALTILSSGIILSLLLLFYHGLKLPLFAATVASILYPSLTCLLLLKYWQKSSKDSYIRRLLYSLLIMFCVLSLGVATITAAMSDLKYTLHLVNFSGALLTYTLPLAAFFLNYFFSKDMYFTLKRHSKQRCILNYLFSKGLFIILTSLVLYIYLSRSGNYSLIPATPAELAVRNWLERYMPARPRFKEFAIGYPCLFIFLYLQKRKIKPYVMFYLGCGITIGSISIINSFCHGFTPVATSMSRTLSGLIIGTLIGSTLLVFLWLADVIHKYRNQSNSSRVRKKLGIKLLMK